MTKTISIQCIHCSEILLFWTQAGQRITELNWLKYDKLHLRDRFPETGHKAKELRKKCFWNNNPALLKPHVLAVFARSETSFTSVSLLLKKNSSSAHWQPETFNFLVELLRTTLPWTIIPYPASSLNSFGTDDNFCGQFKVKLIHKNI